MNSRTTKVLLIFVCLGILLFFALAFGGSVHAHHQGENVIRELKNLDAAKKPSVRAHSFIERHKRHLVAVTCESGPCQYHLLFTDKVLSQIGLAPITDINVYFTFVRGTLATVALAYTSRIFPKNSPTVWVEEDFCANRSDITCNFLALNPHGQDVGPSWNGVVEFGQCAPDKQKQAAWALNLGCLTAFHGCKDISELLPAIWESAKAGTVTSRIANSYPQCRNCVSAEQQPVGRLITRNGR